MSDTITGTVKWFNDEKGFGFIFKLLENVFEMFVSPPNRPHSQLFKNMLISTFGRTYLSAIPQKLAPLKMSKH